MGWWNGKFSRFEVHFGYIEHRVDPQKVFWLHMARHDSKLGLTYAANNAKHKSHELKIFARVVDATNQLCAAMYFNGALIEYTQQGEPQDRGEL